MKANLLINANFRFLRMKMTNTGVSTFVSTPQCSVYDAVIIVKFFN